MNHKSSFVVCPSSFVDNELIFEQLATINERRAIKLGLDRIKACLDYLGNPQEKYKSVIIGGTNGKGSITFYLSNLACKFTNYKIGRYISPHLISWNERFVVNENIIKNGKLNKISRLVIEEIKKFEKLNNEILTLFEILTIIAFKLFEEEKVDIAFLEVGIGGRLDATNVVSSKNTLCSMITNVSLEHTKFLGNTTREIAYEKAGIIKENNHIVTSASEPALSVIESRADELNTRLISLNQNSEKKTYLDKNIMLSLRAWEIILKQLDAKNQRNRETEDLELFLKRLVFPGRFQHLKDKKILLDGAHNADAARELKKLLELKFKDKKIIYIIGMLDKDYKTFIKNLIRGNSLVICTEVDSERTTKKEELAAFSESIGLKTIMCNDAQEAINVAKKKEHDLIVITGSLYLVGEALKLVPSYKR